MNEYKFRHMCSHAWGEVSVHLYVCAGLFARICLQTDKVCVWECVSMHVNAYMLVSLCMSTDVKM